MRSRSSGSYRSSGPHPPFAPPLPFNRMYDPDRMPDPVRGDPEMDHMDEQITWMNYAIWAEDINDPHARVLKARYYGEISYIDECLGRILDAVEARDDADNTLICLFSDHGDHLGDHRAWQKESFFEAACRIPFLVSWPAGVPKACGATRSGVPDRPVRDRHARGGEARRSAKGSTCWACLAGRRLLARRWSATTGAGDRRSRSWCGTGRWKYIFLANGALEQLFDMMGGLGRVDESRGDRPDVAARLRAAAVKACRHRAPQGVWRATRCERFPLWSASREGFISSIPRAGSKDFQKDRKTC